MEPALRATAGGTCQQLGAEASRHVARGAAPMLPGVSALNSDSAAFCLAKMKKKEKKHKKIFFFKSQRTIPLFIVRSGSIFLLEKVTLPGPGCAGGFVACQSKKAVHQDLGDVTLQGPSDGPSFPSSS